jgi:hypothetical protein
MSICLIFSPDGSKKLFEFRFLVFLFLQSDWKKLLQEFKKTETEEKT